MVPLVFLMFVPELAAAGLVVKMEAPKDTKQPQKADMAVAEEETMVQVHMVAFELFGPGPAANSHQLA